MPRFIRKFPRIGHSLGPSEERGFALWVGYEIDDADPEDLESHGYISVDSWSDERLAAYEVAIFKAVTAEDLGLRRKKS